MTKIILCDLSHTTQGPTSELVPYPIGCIKSYYHTYGKYEADIILVKDPNILGQVFAEFEPQIVGFSNYMWNSDLSARFARMIKNLIPETLIIFGGPNFSPELTRQEEWLKKHDMVDLYLTGEGEIPFKEAVDKWITSGSIEAVKNADIFGTRAISKGKLLNVSRLTRNGTQDAPRMIDLDCMPSPYCMGYLDDFLKESTLVPLMESNRGCPFTCTYCVDGMAVRSKVYKAPTARLIAELTYIAERYQGKSIYFADANFGMYREDVDFCRAIKQIKKKYDFPHYIITSTGKNQKSRIIECSKLLEGTLRVAASVQSLDGEVLQNIKRSNIPYKQLIDLSQQLSNTNANTYSEMILGLPGDTRMKHVNGVMALVDAGFNEIRMHSLLLIEGSEMETVQQRSKFGLETMHRVLQRSFGAYPFGSETIRSIELEEVVVCGRGFSFEDYLYCRRFNLSVALFYNERVFFELQNFVKQRGEKVSEWLMYLHNDIDNISGPLRDVYDRFTQETKDELHMCREEIVGQFLTNDDFFQSFIQGVRGNNLLFNTQAHVFVYLMAELHDFTFQRTRNYLVSKNVELSPFDLAYLSDLERYSFEKKRNFTDLDSYHDLEFTFDFTALELEQFEKIPTHKTPSRIRFFYEPWQRTFFSDQFRVHGLTPQSLGKIFARSPIKNAQRHVVRIGDGK
jgi:hypothetical protein